jgi:hypothetical protein
MSLRAGPLAGALGAAALSELACDGDSFRESSLDPAVEQPTATTMRTEETTERWVICASRRGRVAGILPRRGLAVTVDSLRATPGLAPS